MDISCKNWNTKVNHSSAATLEIMYGNPLRPIFSYKSSAGFARKTIPTPSSLIDPDAIKRPSSIFPFLLVTVVEAPWRESKLSITFGAFFLLYLSEKQGADAQAMCRGRSPLKYISQRLWGYSWNSSRMAYQGQPYSISVLCTTCAGSCKGSWSTLSSTDTRSTQTVVP